MIRLILSTVLTSVLISSTSFAQERPRDATAKARGTNSFWVGATRQRHARDYARVLNQFGRSSPTVSRDIVQGHATAVRTNSQAAMKEFNNLKAAYPDDKAVQAQIDKIRKHHEKVLAMCTMLDEECRKPEAGGTTICECCLTMAKELEAADQEAEKLRELMKIEPLADPLKEEAKK